MILVTGDLEQQINRLSLKTVAIASLILIVCVILAKLLRKHKKLKLPLFLTMAGTLIISTAILFGSTIYLNVKAESKGPVHWHTDIEFWACGVELELRDPSGWLSNKIGTSTYHEHNDKRIHLEGVVVRRAEDASLRKFMSVTGGYITKNSIAVPLNRPDNQWFVSGAAIDGDDQPLDRIAQVTPFVKFDGGKAYMELKNGDYCDTKRAELQVFVLSFDEATKTYRQEKLADPSSYIMRDEAIVPPGDCVIVEFDSPKPKTNKLCEQYGVRDKKRCTEFGVKEFSSEHCNIQEAN